MLLLEAGDEKDKGPFLTVVIRTCQRPAALKRAILSVVQQTCTDIEIVFIVDREKKGRWAADKALHEHRDRVDGTLVYILDDDCMLIEPTFVAELKKFWHDAEQPDVMMVRSFRPQIKPHRLPHDDVWMWSDLLRMSTTNCLCYAIRNELWKEHIHMYGDKPAAGDWHFLGAVRDSGALFAWLDLLVAKTCQIGAGVHFERCGPDWFEGVAEEFEIEEVAPDDWRLRMYRWDQMPRKWLREPPKEPKAPGVLTKPRIILRHPGQLQARTKDVAQLPPQRSQPRDPAPHVLDRRRK